MAKRFTDSRKWVDPFFLGLPNEYKLFWIYILDTCDHAGIYKVNLKLSNFCIGSSLNKEDLLKVFKGRIVSIGEDKWFIPKFISFQYGELDDNSRTHKSVIDILKKEGVWKGYARSIYTSKAKAKDKDKDKDKRKGLSDQDFLKTLKDNPAYKHINIDIELGKMDAWLSTHKGRQKTRRFIVNWLNKIDKPFVAPKKAFVPPKPQQKPNPEEKRKVSELISKTAKEMK